VPRSILRNDAHEFRIVSRVVRGHDSTKGSAAGSIRDQRRAGGVGARGRSAIEVGTVFAPLARNSICHDEYRQPQTLEPVTPGRRSRRQACPVGRAFLATMPCCPLQGPLSLGIGSGWCAVPVRLHSYASPYQAATGSSGDRSGAGVGLCWPAVGRGGWLPPSSPWAGRDFLFPQIYGGSSGWFRYSGLRPYCGSR